MSHLKIGWVFLIIGIIFIFLENFTKNVYSALSSYAIAFVFILIGVILIIIGRIKEKNLPKL